MLTGTLLFRGVTLHDFGGPLQIYVFAPSLKVVLVAEAGKPDVLLLPGGRGIPAAIANRKNRQFLKVKARPP